VLAGELTSSVDQVNRLAAASLGDPDSALGAAVRVLNTQLQVRRLGRRGCLREEEE
jgi:hypothetical protein